MKDVMMKLLFAGVALGLFAILIIGSLWDDAKTMDTKKDSQITKVTIPTS